MPDIESLTLRPASDADHEFLYLLYAESRQDEVKSFGWAEADSEAFIRMQFNAREPAYRLQFPGADSYIISVFDTPAGRMIVDRQADAITLVDIAVSKKYRGHGIATTVIGRLKVEAAEDAKAIRLRVEKGNQAARRLYERLGFTVTAETDVLWGMEWRNS